MANDNPPPAHAVDVSLAAHLAAIVASSSDAIYTYDFTGQILSWNRAAELLYGYTSAEVIGQLVDVIVPEDRRAEAQEVIAATVRQGQALPSFETVRRRRDGHRLDVVLTASPVCHPDGQPVAVSVVARDISDRKRADDAVRRSEAEFRSLFEVAGVCHAEIDVPSGRFVRVNQSYCDLLGYSAEELVGGLTLLDVTHPDDRPDNIRATDPLVQGSARPAQIEKRYVRKDGRVVWVLVTSTPIGDAQGQTRRLLGTVLDITARKADEEQLRLHARIAGQVSDAIVATDAAQRVTFWNAAAERLYGVPAAEALGQPLTALYTYQWLAPGDEAAAWTALMRDRAWRGENLHVTRDGRTIHVESLVSVQCLQDGSTAGFVASIRDMTEHQRSAQALRDSEENFRAMFEVSSVGKVQLDPSDGRILQVNDAFCAMIGRTRDALLASNIAAITHPDDRADDRAGLARLMRGETRAYRVEKRYVRPDGVIVWAHIDANLIRGADGRPLRTVAVIQDITERNATQARLREREHFLQRLTEVSPSIISVFDLVAERTLFINRPVEAELGYSSGEIAAMGGDVVPTLMHPDDLGRFPAHLARVRALRDDEFADFEHRMRDRAGEWHWFHSRDAVFARDAAGAASQVISAAIEISAQKEAAAEVVRSTTALRESDTRLRLATEATAVGVWEWDLRLNTIRWDAQMFRIYGIAPTPDGLVRYSDWTGAVLPEDLLENERILQDTIQRRGQSRREFRVRRRDDGAVRDIEAVETVRPNDQGQPDYVVGTNLDITERRQDERRLRQAAADLTDADRRKDEFLATLAHELRNPLAPIRTGLALLRGSEGRTPHVEALATIMERQVGHIVRLVDDLLDVSRVTTGKVHLQPEPVLVATVVADAVAAVRPLMKELGHTLTVSVPPAPIVLDIDPVRMSQVIGNLLVNAAKFTERQGKIGLIVEQFPNDVVISVTDTGVGLASGDEARIFDLFTQIEPSRGHAQGGLGIGLALSKRLVEMHGGTIHAMSAGLGLGSDFVVRLPLSSAVPPALSPGPAAGHLLVHAPRRILIVDDNRDGADTLAMMLQADGHDIRTAYDGETAVEAAAAFRPEVVLLDIGLPVMDGYDVCRHLRAQDWAAGLVILAMTGWASDQDRRRSLDAGFDQHLVKPVDPDALRRLLEVPLDRGSLPAR